MAKWTYYLTVVNELDRPLELISENLAWGRKERKEGNFPRIIAPRHKCRIPCVFSFGYLHGD